MRYWGILLGKVLATAAVLYGVWSLMWAWYDPPEYIIRYGHSPFSHDLLWTSLMLLLALILEGLVFLIIWDQRYRCRTCGRRLRMPVRTGSYGHRLLFGSPKTEYICTYGHGTLRVPELHFSGKDPSSWEANDDFWKELYEADRKRD